MACSFLIIVSCFYEKIKKKYTSKNSQVKAYPFRKDAEAFTIFRLYCCKIPADYTRRYFAVLRIVFLILPVWIPISGLLGTDWIFPFGFMNQL